MLHGFRRIKTAAFHVVSFCCFSVENVNVSLWTFCTLSYFLLHFILLSVCDDESLLSCVSVIMLSFREAVVRMRWHFTKVKGGVYVCGHIWKTSSNKQLSGCHSNRSISKHHCALSFALHHLILPLRSLCVCLCVLACLLSMHCSELTESNETRRDVGSVWGGGSRNVLQLSDLYSLYQTVQQHRCSSTPAFLGCDIQSQCPTAWMTGLLIVCPCVSHVCCTSEGSVCICLCALLQVCVGGSALVSQLEAAPRLFCLFVSVRARTPVHSSQYTVSARATPVIAPNPKPDDASISEEDLFQASES